MIIVTFLYFHGWVTFVVAAAAINMPPCWKSFFALLFLKKAWDFGSKDSPQKPMEISLIQQKFPWKGEVSHFYLQLPCHLPNLLQRVSQPSGADFWGITVLHREEGSTDIVSYIPTVHRSFAWDQEAFFMNGKGSSGDNQYLCHEIYAS